MVGRANGEVEAVICKDSPYLVCSKICLVV